MTTYYKAVLPDGTDFHSGTVRWLPEDGVIPPEGWLVTHPTATKVGPKADEYLSASTVATECYGAGWPCRLLRLERAGRQVRIPEPDDFPHKRASVAWLVVEELPAHLTLGPQGEEVAAIFERGSRLTGDDIDRLGAARDAARDAAWNAVLDATWGAALNAAEGAAWDSSRGTAWEAIEEVTWDATWSATWDAPLIAAWGATRDAAYATLVRDLISAEHHDLLMGPWRSVIGDAA